MEKYRQSNTVPLNRVLKSRKEFSDREVGLTHPDMSSFIRLNDNGDIEIFAAPGIGMVISSSSRSISFFGNFVKFFTKDDGLRWNTYKFNMSSYDYSQPTLVKINKKEMNSAQDGVYHYLSLVDRLDQEESDKPITITGKHALGEAGRIEYQNLTSEEDYSDLSEQDVALLEVYATDYSRDHLDLIVKFLREGLNFSQAHQRALREGSNE